MKQSGMKQGRRAGARQTERGAALITTLLLSFLLLAAGGALLLASSFTVTNSFDPAAEAQAYYAAETGLQRTLNILRGNVGPNITYRAAITPAQSNYAGDSATTARLSNWLNYSASYTDRVELTPDYTPLNGLAFNTAITDPDNSHLVSFTTTGTFPNGTSTLSFGSGGHTTSIVYLPQSGVTLQNVLTNPSTTIGSFRVSGDPILIPLTNFTLTITQTSPWQATAVINCTLQGAINSAATPLLLTFPSPAYDLEGVTYTLTNMNPLPPNTKILLGSNTGVTTPLSINLSAPEPRRVLVRVNGYGPRSARKQMQMMVGRFVLNYSPRGTIAIRGSDTPVGNPTVLNFQAGSSSQYIYDGNATSGGSAIAGFALTNTPDYNYVLSQVDPGQVRGNPKVQLVPMSSLPPWLQTAESARTTLNQLQVAAQYQHRYFQGQPPDLGTSAAPKFTFVDGDVDLPPSGGAGLLVVTGTLTARGSTSFDGLILVLGNGVILRDGGGNGNTLGAVALARFDRNDPNGTFLPPTFITNGGGTSTVQYDPNAVQRALGLGGRLILGVSEY